MLFSIKKIILYYLVFLIFPIMAYASNWAAPIEPIGPPSTPQLISPIFTSPDDSPTYIWKNIIEATWYYLVIEEKNTGKRYSNWYHYLELGCFDGEQDICSITPNIKLANGSQISWTVRASSSRIKSGNTSSPFLFTIDRIQRTNKPELIYPRGHVPEGKIDYSWSAVTDSSYYHLVITVSSVEILSRWYSASEVGCTDGKGSCSIALDISEPSSTGGWKVRGYSDSSGNGIFSDKKFFFFQRTGKGFPTDPTGEVPLDLSGYTDDPSL